MSAVSYAIRIQRWQRKRDECWTQLAHQEPDSRVARFLRARITNCSRAIAAIERLEWRAGLKAEQQAIAALQAAARAGAAPVSVTSPRPARSTSGGSAPLPLSAKDYRPARDSELDLVLVWTPHRDAPSLIGSYDSRPR